MGFLTGEFLQRVETAVDRTFRMAMALPTNIAGRVIAGQIIRSSGGAGANLEEAAAVFTRRDYTNKISISLREARETLYWTRRVERNKLLPARRLHPLLKEWNEIVAVMTAAQKKLRKSAG